jgi:hypothetical protein
MKLTDITQIAIITEGLVNPNALLALQSVATSGKFSNKFEELVVAKFGQLIKDGTFWSIADPLFTNSTSVNVYFLNELKSLPPEELQKLAAYIYSIACSKNGTALNCYASMSTTDWMKLYTSREATD